MSLYVDFGLGLSMMRTGAFSAMLLLSLVVMGCVRREGRNTDCKWPLENYGHRADARHLSADAEFAEDLAIRYADSHYGLRTRNYVSGEVYAAARDRCMQSLFEQIAKQHGVGVVLISNALGRNRAGTDLAVNLPFAFLYCIVVIALARFTVQRYPPDEHGWIPAGMMALFLSVVIAATSSMLGEVWSGLAESWRIGNGHMSYRLQRLWWVRHRTEVFTGAIATFWFALPAIAIRSRYSDPSASKRPPIRNV